MKPSIQTICATLLSVVLLPVAPLAAAATNIFAWVDDAGLNHFSDQPPPQQLAINQAVPAAATAPVQVQRSSDFERDLSAGPERITIYTEASCNACDAAKQYFRDHAISYTEHDLRASPSARTEVQIMQARNLPVILVRDQRMVGFNATKFEQIWQG